MKERTRPSGGSRTLVPSASVIDARGPLAVLAALAVADGSVRVESSGWFLPGMVVVGLALVTLNVHRGRRSTPMSVVWLVPMMLAPVPVLWFAEGGAAADDPVPAFCVLAATVGAWWALLRLYDQERPIATSVRAGSVALIVGAVLYAVAPLLLGLTEAVGPYASRLVQSLLIGGLLGTAVAQGVLHVGRRLAARSGRLSGSEA